MNIIGIMGKAGSGKDTVGEFIAEKGYQRMALADEIKRTAKRWWGYTDRQLWGPSETRMEKPAGLPDGPTARHALQQIGTEVARAIDPDLWIRILIDNANAILTTLPKAIERVARYDIQSGVYLGMPNEGEPSTRGVVVTDVRFPNEVALIRKAGGAILKVVRPDANPLVEVAANHRSETEMDQIPECEIDVVVINDGSLDDLRAKAVKAMIRLEERTDR